MQNIPDFVRDNLQRLNGKLPRDTVSAIAVMSGLEQKIIHEVIQGKCEPVPRAYNAIARYYDWPLWEWQMAITDEDRRRAAIILERLGAIHARIATHEKLHMLRVFSDMPQISGQVHEFLTSNKGIEAAIHEYYGWSFVGAEYDYPTNMMVHKLAHLWEKPVQELSHEDAAIRKYWEDVAHWLSLKHFDLPDLYGAVNFDMENIAFKFKHPYKDYPVLMLL